MAAGHSSHAGPARTTATDVVVYRDVLLRDTETFIVNQAAAMQRWRPRFVGLKARSEALAVQPDLLLSTSSLAGRVRRRVVTARRRSGALAHLLSSPSVGVVHAHFGCDGIFVAEEARRAGVPLVVTFHGYDVNRLPNHPSTGARYRAQLAELFASAAVLVATSDFIAAKLLALGAPEHKVRRLYVGIPVPQPFAAPPPARRVLFVGRLIDVKGPEDLLAAVAALPPHLRDVPVRVYGDGGLREELEQRAGALGVRAEFLGHRPPAEVAADMARGGVFCAPSRRTASGDEEGFGMVFAEAAAAGLAVVSCRTGGVPEAVDDGVSGLLVPERDPAALSAALGQLLDDPERARRMGAAGRARVEALFDVRRQTQRLEEVYDELARPRGALAGAAATVATGSARRGGR